MITVAQVVRTSFAAVLLVGAAAWVAGCKDEPKTAAAPAPAPVAEAPPAPPPEPVSLSQIKSDLIGTKAQIKATIDALNKLPNSSGADAVANYNAYSEQYLKLKTIQENVREHAADLKKRGADYLAMWDKQASVQNAELRRQAVQQRGEADQLLNTIAAEMEMARIEFAPLMANLTDVGNYLHDNLTPANLQSTSDLVAKAGDQATTVNKHIDGIIGALDTMAVALGQSSTQLQSAPPPAGAQPASDVQTPAPAAPNTAADSNAK